MDVLASDTLVLCKVDSICLPLKDNFSETTNIRRVRALLFVVYCNILNEQAVFQVCCITTSALTLIWHRQLFRKIPTMSKPYTSIQVPTSHKGTIHGVLHKPSASSNVGLVMVAGAGYVNRTYIVKV